MEAVAWGLIGIGGFCIYYGGIVGTKVGYYGESVANFPLLIIGAVAVLAGVILYTKKDTLTKIEINGNVVKDLSSDAYKIYLTKKYDIQLNAALGKYIAIDKLFDEIGDALIYADAIEKISKAAAKFDFS